MTIILRQNITPVFRLSDPHSMEVITNMTNLIVNLQYWISHGLSETASRAIKDAQYNGWEKMGWKALLDHRESMKEEARDGC
jgi:hypothetical protein